MVTVVTVVTLLKLLTKCVTTRCHHHRRSGDAARTVGRFVKKVKHSGKIRRTLSRRQRFDVLEKCGYRCVYCGRGCADGVSLQVDHSLPVSCGGGDDAANLVASCVDCNYGKRDRIVALPLARTFLGWLRAQRARDDIVGDLSRDEARHVFVEPVSFKHLTRQVRNVLQPSRTWALDGSPIYAAWHAWREYRRGGKQTLAVEKFRLRDEEFERAVRARGTTSIWKVGELVN